MRNPRYGEWKATLGKVCDYFAVFAVGFLTILAALSKQDGDKFNVWPAPVHATISWLLDNNWWLAVALAFLVGAAKVTKEYLETSWVWTAVQAIVDRIQKDAFANQQGYAHHHRATLFQFQRYKWWPFPARHVLWPWGRGKWPCSGWLIPVIRSGQTEQRSSTYFLAPDGDSIEGVAGHIWASNKEIALAVAAALQPGASDADITAYAGGTFMSETMVRRELSNNKVLAASFRGIPIEGKAGKRWGVLVLDSRDPTAAKDANLNVGPYAYCLGKLLERI